MNQTLNYHREIAPATPTREPREGDVSAELMEMKRNVEHTGALVAALREMLSPILGPGAPTSANTARPPANCAMANGIRSLNEELNSINTALNELREGLRL